MSQHPSLRSASKSKQHRSVLKRFERIQLLKDKEEWAEEDSVFGLPKVKTLKLKTSKGKTAEEKTAEAGAEGAAPEAAAEEAKTEGTDKKEK